eukprot:CAMPEP_0206568668 /NCGR_PEP_ID=MMETSP0325_2-20121206/25965_1 /ASSEMBLY_ACC=CAM_ASM_000347 /TAXON_ID=2866 /ORGANISM="Crypthecodinium cohnii, Strain Seligo" /LENGTH=527 /DNA_ID=CAMNT_0054072081 /DNA_START=58 /DNA_END=1641 /DNA_ORIENTATION=-
MAVVSSKEIKEHCDFEATEFDVEGGCDAKTLSPFGDGDDDLEDEDYMNEDMVICTLKRGSTSDCGSDDQRCDRGSEEDGLISKDLEKLPRQDSCASNFSTGSLSKVKVPNHGQVTTWAATTNLVTCMIGASVLSLPKMVADSGWIMGVAMLVLAGGTSSRASQMVCQSLHAVRESGGDPQSIGDVVEVCFGIRSKKLVLVLVSIFQICKCGVYFVVVGANLHYWLDTLTSRQCTFIAVGCGFWTVFIRSVSTISKGAALGALASVVYILSISSASATAASSLPIETRSLHMWPENLGNLPQIFAVMLYAYSPADVLPTLQKDMVQPEQLPVAVFASHVIVALAYVALACAGYFGWGRSVAGNVLQSMCEPPGCPGVIPDDVRPGAKWTSGYILSIAVVTNLAVTIPIVLYCVIFTMESQFATLKTSRFANLTMRLGVVLGSVAIALFVPFFIEILGVISTVLLVSIQILLPCIISWSLSREGKSRFGALEYGLFVLGCVVMVIGLNSSLRNLAAAIRAANSKQTGGA